MGACVSIHHKPSAVKVQLSFDSTHKPDHPPLSNAKLPIMDGHVAVKPQLPPSQSPPVFSDYGSKEETFFDSQAWLDSDYEDDFMSVNGEFTPSRGNTPVHHSLPVRTPQFNGGSISTVTDNNESTSQPSPTPTEKKMRLLDLFKESVRENHDFNDKDGEMSSNQDVLKTKREGCFSTLLSARKKKSPIPSLSLGCSPVAG